MVRDVGKWQQVRIERLTKTQDALGGVIETWALHLNVYANVYSISGKEFFESDKRNVIKSARFYTYYFSDLTEKDRIKFENDYYNIVYISTRGLREGLEIVGEVTR